MNNVLGFSRETLANLITNTEGREWHRRKVIDSTRKPEHPKAPTTNNVECLFSLVRDSIGQNFTTKQIGFNIHKVYTEFTKGLDPDLPFFYHTTALTQHREGPLPNFNTPLLKPPKKKRVPRREQPVRPCFHNVPLDLSPPPGEFSHLINHSYV